jgi:hypothetical protein
VRWLQLKAATAARLAWRDATQVGASRVATGLAVNVISVILALILTRRLIALWAIAAAPIYVVLAWCFFFTRRMFGWNRLWKRDKPIVGHNDTGPVISLALQTMRSELLISGTGYELECLVREPSGQEIKNSNMTGFHNARVFVSYPVQFAGAPPMVPGSYDVTWREQNPKTGKWRIIDIARVALSEHDFQHPAAGQASPAPASGP